MSNSFFFQWATKRLTVYGSTGSGIKIMTDSRAIMLHCPKKTIDLDERPRQDKERCKGIVLGGGQTTLDATVRRKNGSEYRNYGV